MRALQYSSYGGPEVLSVGAAPDPQPGPGQVRVQVKASAVNVFDSKLFSGAMSGGRALQGTAYVGLEAAGVVDQVGPDVTDVTVGDDVFGLGRNTAAELALLDAWAPKPASVDWAVAASAGVSTETSTRSLDLLAVGAGSTVLIDGGAGGVGAVAVQLARARGATVVASAGEDNQGYLEEIGAIPVLYGDGLADRVRAAAPHGVDAVLDVAGKTAPAQLVSLVSDPAQVVSIANFSGEAGIRATSVSGDRRAALALAAELLGENRLVIKVQTFPLQRAQEAYRISQGGHVRGKLVLLP